MCHVMSIYRVCKKQNKTNKTEKNNNTSTVVEHDHNSWEMEYANETTNKGVDSTQQARGTTTET